MKKDKLSFLSRILWLPCLTVLPAHAQSEPVDTNRSEISKIDVNFFSQARVQYQSISQSNLDNTAEALGFRVKAGLEFQASNWLSALVEIEGSDFLIDDFNNTINSAFDVPVIPDPSNLEINRLQLQSEFGDNRFTIGRQDFALDNWRFLGNWQFRQNDQTFDAVSYTHLTLPTKA